MNYGTVENTVVTSIVTFVIVTCPSWSHLECPLILDLIDSDIVGVQ